MLFGNNRESLRKMYRDALSKSVQGLPMTALETQIADIIHLHPEYKPAIDPQGSNPDLDKDYLPESGEANPFMHMSLHLAVRDQLATNRPAGIREAFTALRSITADTHEAEHVLCELMGEELWHAQRSGRPPDESRYLAQVQRRLAKKHP